VGAETDRQVLDRVNIGRPFVGDDSEHLGVADEGGWLAHSRLQGGGELRSEE
jgi:hypothetical protein